jgi:hypothetical protein
MSIYIVQSVFLDVHVVNLDKYIHCSKCISRCTCREFGQTHTDTLICEAKLAGTNDHSD